ncbi:iron-sulfur cluster assembly accessory protein [Chromatium okenii]|uniref:HesB/IscA family protein n=1 Tax=Chromatium okenii TaxID=61644 RepID=UPI0026EDC063|nr:iron-sulfur cluster assembly accessory protein [Chromatium okenii]MBV5310330.1 iron-sulfur cluster assembly accessory protein [Chromatium okenii]
MAITLTEAAAKHVTAMLARHGNSIGLRIGTKKSGCNGFAYVVDYAEQITDTDCVFESQGIQIVIDNAQLTYLDGVEIDFVRSSLLNEGFEFRNPQAKERCGCGESFSI